MKSRHSSTQVQTRLGSCKEELDNPCLQRRALFQEQNRNSKAFLQKAKAPCRTSRRWLRRVSKCSQLQSTVSLSIGRLTRGASTYVILLGNALNKRDHLQTSCRIKSAYRFVEEQQLRARDQLTSDTNTTFLASTNALSNRGSNQSMLLFSEAKRVK